MSGGALFYGNAVIGHWSKTQSNVALSSGEAELNASVKGLAELIGSHGVGSELGNLTPELVLETDASACKGMLLRRCVGRVKHLSTKQLWVQGAIEVYSIVIRKIPRVMNPADLLTHIVGKEDLLRMCSMLGFTFPA